MENESEFMGMETEASIPGRKCRTVMYAKYGENVFDALRD